MMNIMAYIGIFYTFMFVCLGFYLYWKCADSIELTKQNIQEKPTNKEALDDFIVRHNTETTKVHIRNEKYCQALIQNWPNCEIDFTAPSVEELSEKIKV